MKNLRRLLMNLRRLFGKIRRLFQQNQRGSEMKLPGIIFDSRYL